MTNDELTATISSINEKLKTIFKFVEKLDKKVNGNGEEGLVSRVAKLEERTGLVWTLIEVFGYALTTGIAAYAAFFKH